MYVKLWRSCAGVSQTACSCFSERVQALLEPVLKSPDLLLSRVGSSAVACRKPCCRCLNRCRGEWNYCCGVPDQVQRQMEQVLSRVGTSAEVSGTTAVACRNYCCRLADRVQRGRNQCCSVSECLLSQVCTRAGVRWHRCWVCQDGAVGSRDSVRRIGRRGRGILEGAR
jgi:hypothetical protein